jgi:hypothetical protein
MRPNEFLRKLDHRATSPRSISSQRACAAEVRSPAAARARLAFNAVKTSRFVSTEMRLSSATPFSGTSRTRQIRRIRARTSEGRARAKARGVKVGRKSKLTDHQKREAIRRRDRNGEPVRDIARNYNVSHNTISRLAVST